MEPAGANEHGGGGYHFGSSPEELERLNRQGEVLAAPTRMILQAAGIGSGMRVLDLGTGTGDVAFVAADLVGPAGEVVGIDRSQDALSLAGARSRQRGLATVRFVLGDIHEPAPGGPFDAIVARLVLMYVPEPATVLRVQSELLRPGGVVAPIEFDVRTARSMPPTPLVGQALAWLAGAFERGGIEPSMGPRLWTILEDAGLRPMGMMGSSRASGPATRPVRRCSRGSSGPRSP